MTELLRFHPFLDLICAVIILMLALYSITQNPKDRLTRAFFLFIIITGIACLMEYSLRVAPSIFAAEIIDRIRIIFWALAFPPFLCFSMVFSRNDYWLRNRITYLMIYLPTVALVIFYIFAPPMVRAYKQTIFGIIPDYYLIYYLVAFGQMGMYLNIGLILIIIETLRSKNQLLKRSGFLIILAGILPGIFVPFTMVAIPLTFKIDFPIMVVPIVCVSCILTYYAIRKYSLFTISPAQAVDAILESTFSAILALDADGKICFVNESAGKLLEAKEKGQLVNAMLSDFFNAQDVKKIQDVLLVEGRAVKEYETELKTIKGEKKWIMLNGIILKDPLGAKIGGVLDLMDITQQKQSKDQIAEHVTELEQLNKFMVGRENVMINLKKEINDLLRELGRPRKY